MSVWQALIILGVSTLIGALAWLINKILGVYRELTDSINKLNITITGINGVLLSLQEGSENFRQSCVERHRIVETRLNAHSEKINGHETEIAVLKSMN